MIKDYLQLLNGILNLTEKELEVLAAFIEFNPVKACTRRTKEQVRIRFKFKNIPVVNNIVKSLKDKGVIILTEDKEYTYNPIVIPKEGIKKVSFILEYNEE